jgi:Glycosyltransferase family 87
MWAAPPMPRSSKPRLASYAALIAALTASVVLHVLPAWDAKAFDLSALVVGAAVVQRDGFSHLYEHDPALYNRATSPPFERAARELGFDDVPTPFVYAPLIAVLVEPLTSVPYRWVARAWCAASALCIALGLLLGIRYFAPELVRTPLAFAGLALALSLFEPIRYALWLGQTTPLVFLCVMFALVAAARDRPLFAGVALAVPVFVKLTPVLFVLPWLWRRRYRAAAALACALGALALGSVAVAGAGTNLTFVGRVRGIGRETVVAYNNQGLAALLERMHQPASEVMRWNIVPLSVATRLAVGACVTVMVLGAGYALRHARDRDRERLAFAVVTTVVLLAPSMAWTHYSLFLLPPLLGCVELALQAGRRWLGVSAGFGVLAMCSRPLLLDHIDHHRGPVTVIVGPTIAALILYALAIAVARLRAPASKTGAPCASGPAPSVDKP